MYNFIPDRVESTRVESTRVESARVESRAESSLAVISSIVDHEYTALFVSAISKF
jgi:hypothetical protein